MQPANNAAINYSNLPIVCTSAICEHLAASGPAPLVSVRSVNQDFFRESRIPLARSVIKELEAVHYTNTPDPEERLHIFEKYLRYLKSANGLPDKLREKILNALCNIVNTLPNRWFHAGWRDMVAQFNTESDSMRAALRENMNRAWGRVELYGDGGTKFDFNNASHRGE